MKYIENFELREWVKDNLKKTIFQKAHALAVQTGCQIIVKLQDDLDVTQHQYYATDRLRKVFKNNGLRQRAGEKFVSGVTGEPLIDQAVQSDDTEHIGLQTSSGEVSDIDQIPSGIENRVESQGDDRVKPENGTSMCSEEPAIPVHMSMTCEMSEDTGMETSSQTDRHSAEETDDVYEGGGDAAPHVKIKEEPIDDDDPGGDGDDTTPMYQDQDLDSTTPTSQSGTQLLGASQFQGAATAPSTSQYLSTSSYQIPMSPKPYQCAMCGKAFRSVQVLQKHTHTFHMKTQHLMGARTSRGRGRGRQTGPRLMQLGANPTQPNSFTCIMCNISFPEVEILQDHMSRTHMGAASSGPPHTEGSPGNPNYSTPSTSQQATAFPSPSSDTPAAQGSPYSQQPGTSSSVPIFPMPLSSPSGSRASTSPGTARMGLGKFRSGNQQPSPNSPVTIANIMRAILLTTGPVNNCSSFLHSGPTHMRHTVTVEKYNKAAMQLQEEGMGEFVRMDVSGYLREVFVKKVPKEAETILAKNPLLCDPLVYALRYYMPLPSKFRTKMRQKLVELGYVTEEQVFRACRI
ncbi:uncharacterized protein [Amphiura filiformis]|uniref:uncharacterized protein isoform X4 n=1 Tax=Amphiura filiformis TaxID=82378 RepID=UPI003B21B3AA